MKKIMGVDTGANGIHLRNEVVHQAVFGELYRIVIIDKGFNPVFCGNLKRLEKRIPDLVVVHARHVVHFAVLFSAGLVVAWLDVQASWLRFPDGLCHGCSGW